MNLRSFLNQIDTISKEMSVSELQAFVHENGRTLPEQFRKDYINTLKSFSSLCDDSTDAGRADGNEPDFQQRYEQLKEQLEEISEGELCLGGELNYEYDEWYNSDADEFVLSDPDGIVDVICEACAYVHKCVDCAEYALGCRLAECLMGLEISAEIDGGYEFYDTLGVGDLKQYHLGNIDYKGFVVDSLYCAYWANDLKSRPEALYLMIQKSELNSPSLEMIMQNGEELTDINDFLPEWITYLGSQTETNAQNLLTEALTLTGNPALLLESARLYYELHPSLYEQYIDSLLRDKAPSQEILQAGDEALGNIDVNYVIRSRIAKKTGMLALESGNKDLAEKYWFEAFRSETNVTNYMVLFTLCDHYDSYLDEIREIYHSMYQKSDKTVYLYESQDERKRNNPDLCNVYMLAILGGEFRYVREHAMNVTAALGWSSTFMKCGLAASILLLYEADELQPASREMCRRIVSSVQFDRKDYDKYTGKRTELDSENFFWQCLQLWKQKYGIDTAEKQAALSWMEQNIRKRVDGIMNGNKRNYYGECASYIAAYGEMLESRGDAGARQRILLEYRQLYSRRSAFHQELRKYGMRDPQKKR